jgi:RecA/RadA recombinase
MNLQHLVLEELDAILQRNCIVSISGESGTGKTTLGLFLVAYTLVKKERINNSCLWIQASEEFPKKRLISMYEDDRELCNYLLNNIYIAPKKIFYSYLDQTQFLSKIASGNSFLPPDLNYIVIDNISHHLRFQFSNSRDIKPRMTLLDEFYNNILCPLVLRCQRENIPLTP